MKKLHFVKVLRELGSKNRKNGVNGQVWKYEVSRKNIVMIGNMVLFKTFKKWTDMTVRLDKEKKHEKKQKK